MTQALTAGQRCPGSCVRNCTAQFPHRHGRHNADLAGRRLRHDRCPRVDGDLLCSRGNSDAHAVTDRNAHGGTFSDTNPFGNTFGDTISDANGDPIADRHAQSDAAATPDTVSSADALTRSRNSLCGSSRKKLASSRGGANGLNLRALSEGRIACSGKCESASDRCKGIAKPVSVLGEAAHTCQRVEESPRRPFHLS